MIDYISPTSNCQISLVNKDVIKRYELFPDSSLVTEMGKMRSYMIIRYKDRARYDPVLRPRLVLRRVFSHNRKRYILYLIDNRDADDREGILQKLPADAITSETGT